MFVAVLVAVLMAVIVTMPELFMIMLLPLVLFILIRIDLILSSFKALRVQQHPVPTFMLFIQFVLELLRQLCLIKFLNTLFLLQGLP